MLKCNAEFLRNTPAFIKQITRALHERNRHEGLFSKGIANSSITSAVLFLLGPHCEKKRFSSEPCLILNKRSPKVRQPGDLCCPGGTISTYLDSYLAKLLYLPGSPLVRWPYWPLWRKQRHQDTQSLALLFATCLRESFEEMRLNPFRVKFLGPLPSQQLVMFRRVIYPMVCLISRQKRFFPNWEVEKVVYIPFQNLLNPSNYARYQLHIETSHKNEKDPNIIEYPCFLHEHKDESEVLWGATFRITMVFLEIVFGFKPPDIKSLPVVHGTLDANYLTGNA
ncbi:MAG: hypothetical protein BBJ57_07805 [Desulfobacterales bacterium PC51MH44]|nr:MAG: hypothetical protein BBJ57_07805 [Desulfobacterales bacterium PC51MH44]